MKKPESSKASADPLTLLTRRGRAPASFETVAADADVRISNYRLAPGDVVELAGYGVTSRTRTAYDLLRSRLPFDRARLVACRLLVLTEPGSRQRIAARAQVASKADRARIERRLAGGSMGSP